MPWRPAWSSPTWWRRPPRSPPAAVAGAGLPAPDQIGASGGGTASPLWRQILADVLGAEIATVNTSEGAAYGAGLLAAVGAAWDPGVEAACDALGSATPPAPPAPAAAPA